MDDPVHVSVVQWIAIAFFILLALAASTRIKEIWRGTSPKHRSMWWNRTLPTGIVIGWTMILQLPLALYEISHPHSASSIIDDVAAVGYALLLVEMVIWVAVASTGFPSFVVPPDLRRAKPLPSPGRDAGKRP